MMVLRSRCHRSRKSLVGLSVAVVMSMAAAAGASSASSGEPTEGLAASSPVEPVEGGSLSIVTYEPLQSWDPALVSGAAYELFAVYDALITLASDGGVEYRLLESAESTDAVTWTLKLRPGLVFSDGTPLDAEAIKFNWERIADPEVASPQASLVEPIESIEVVDDVTLTVTLSDPNATFPVFIANSSLTWIGSPTALADPAAFASSPVGAGAYMIEGWEAGRPATFERNPNYHATTYLDSFTLNLIVDPTQRLSTVQAGDGDLLYNRDGVSQVQIRDAGLSEVSLPSDGGFVLFFNSSKPPFNDIRARQAFAYAIDPAALTEAVIGDVASPATNMFTENSPFYDPALDQLAPDPAKAQELFDEMAEENGGPLEVTLSFIGVGGLTPYASWMQAAMAGYDNVEVTLDPVDPADFYGKYTGGDVQFGIHVFFLASPDQLGVILQTGGKSNFMHYSDPDVDRLLTEAIGTLDEADRIEIYKQIQERVRDATVVHWIHRSEGWWSFDPAVVHGITEDTLRSQSLMPFITDIWVTR